MRIYRQAETFALLAAGPPIVFTPEEEQLRADLKQELLRREREGEIGPLDATSPQSMTDTHETLNNMRRK